MLALLTLHLPKQIYKYLNNQKPMTPAVNYRQVLWSLEPLASFSDKVQGGRAVGVWAACATVTKTRNIDRGEVEQQENTDQSNLKYFKKRQITNTASSTSPQGGGERVAQSTPPVSKKTTRICWNVQLFSRVCSGGFAHPMLVKAASSTILYYFPIVL